MTDPAVIRRNLTVHFLRSVSFPDQKPATLQVIVIPLAEPSSPLAGATFVQPAGVQEVVLARDTDVVFELIPSHLAGLTHELLYRIEWRAGVTGRTFSTDFAMPDSDVNFDELADLGKIIDGEVYLRQQDLGVAGRVARLDADGHVVDAAGQVVATQGALDTLSGQLAAEKLARQQADSQVAANAQAALETQIGSVLDTTAANLSGARASLQASIDSERDSRTAADSALGGRIDGVVEDLGTLTEAVESNTTTLASHTTTLALKADLVEGKVPASQLPTPPPAPVTSVNTKTGAVVLTLSDVAAQGGQVGIDQVEGLQTALDNAGNSADLQALATRVTAIEDDTTIVKTVGGVIDHTLNDDHMAYVNAEGKVTKKDGTVIVVPGSGSVTEVNGQDGIVELDLTDVSAAGGEVPLDQVTGLQTELDGKADTDDPRFTDARTPTAHAASHASGGTDPLTIDPTQVDGLSATLTNNGLTPTSNHETRIQSLELGGGSGGGGDIAKANWFDGTADFTEATPAAFQSTDAVLLKGPFAKKADGTYAYYPGGVAAVGETYLYAYITPNGHLELREWDETNPPDPEPATAEDIDLLTTALSSKASQGALDAVVSDVADKADQSALEALTGTVSTKADQSDLDTLSTTVAAKADKTTVDALTTTVGTKAAVTDMAAAQSAITALQTGKADLSAGSVPLTQLPTYPTSKVGGLDAALAAKADLSGGVLAAAQIPSGIPTSKIAQLDSKLAAKADLDGNGKLASSQLPALGLVTVTVVANKAAMLAQTTSQVQRGDITVINATADKGNYILNGDDPSSFANWVKLATPDGAVSSVNGQAGVVVLTAGDIGARSLADLLAISDVNGLQSALDNKASTAALTSGLSGKTSLADVQAALAASVPVKQRALRVATTAVASLSGAQSIDGAVVGAGNVVLLTAQSSSIQNGLWQVNNGAWTRPTDFASGSYLLRGTLVAVAAGASNANTLWQQTAASGVVDTASNGWVKIGSIAAPFVPAAGNGIDITGNSFAVKPATGIAVSTAGVGIDSNNVPRKATGDVPPGSATVTITHNLNNQWPIVQVYEQGSKNAVLVGITSLGVNAVSLEFASPPAFAQYKWVCIG